MIYAQAHGRLEYDARFQPATAIHGARTTFIVRVVGRAQDAGIVTYLRCQIHDHHAEVMLRHLLKGKRVYVAGVLRHRQRGNGDSYVGMRVQTLEMLDRAPSLRPEFDEDDVDAG